MDTLFFLLLLPFLSYLFSSLLLDASLQLFGFPKKWGFSFRNHIFASFFMGFFVWLIPVNAYEDFSILTIFFSALLILVTIIYIVGTYRIEHPEERSKIIPPDILDDDLET